MRTKLIACFAGICLLCTLYMTYKVYNLNSLIAQLDVKTSALNDRIAKTESISLQNLENTARMASQGTQRSEETAEITHKHKKDKITVPKTENADEPIRNGRAEISANAPLITSVLPPNEKRISKKQVASAAKTNDEAASHPVNSHKHRIQKEPAIEQPAEEAAQVAPKPKAPEEQPVVKTAHTENIPPAADADDNSNALLHQRMKQLKSYAKENSLDNDFGLIADMGINSGKKRFYIVNLNKMSITGSGLVAYSRKADGDGSAHVYKVEKTGSNYYELYSLDKNGNVISPEPEILSSLNCVPNSETGELTCQSDAGPGLSPKLFGELQPIIKERKKPLLLYIYR